MPQETLQGAGSRDRLLDGERAVPRLTVVVPCFNEKAGVLTTLESLLGVLADESFELIVVDDGSTDGTPEVVDRLERSDDRVTVLRHESTRGYGAALQTGIRQSVGDWVLITDADGSYPAEAIPDLLARASRFDMLVASRTLPTSSYPWIRRVPKYFLRSFASWLAGRKIPDMNSGLRLFRRSIAARYLPFLPNGFSFTTTITVGFLAGGRRVDFVPITLQERMGRSKIRPVRDTLGILFSLVRAGMYFAPLRLLAPLIVVLSTAFAASLAYDALVLENLADKTVLLLLFTLNTVLFALLADMIQKQSSR